jgi:hypothetical protein
MRYGQPVIHYIQKDEHGYWLGTAWGYRGMDLNTGQYGQQRNGYCKADNGTVKAYDGTNLTRISKETYEALHAQSRENHKAVLNANL